MSSQQKRAGKVLLSLSLLIGLFVVSLGALGPGYAPVGNWKIFIDSAINLALGCFLCALSFLFAELSGR